MPRLLTKFTLEAKHHSYEMVDDYVSVL